MEIQQNHIGLSSSEAEERLRKYGLNDVEEKRTGTIKKLLLPLFSPISLMLLGAAVLSKFDGRNFDFYFILVLYFVNYFIQKWQEFKADKAIKELQKKLSFNVLTFRDNNWTPVNAKYLVVGDRIRLGLGSIIPADANILSDNNLSVNEAVLTGESLPKEKKDGDKIYSGSFIATGNLEAEITATGRNTSFGKTIFSIEKSTEKSLLEKDILSITRFLTTVSLIAVLVLTVVFYLKGLRFNDILTLDLSLVIAGIPIALPAVMAIILSIGAGGLAKKFVVIRRLSALQDLANVNLLLTDKTGTLTKNEINITKVISYGNNFSLNDVMNFAGFVISSETPGPVDLAVIKKINDDGIKIPEVKVLSFTPYDSDRKRSTAIVETSGEQVLVSMGASQIIESLGKFTSQEVKSNFERDVDLAAEEGFRVLAIAIRKGSADEKDMNIIGLLFLTDILDEGSKDTIKFMGENGIGIKVLTGDNRLITGRITKELGLDGEVLPLEETREFYKDDNFSFDKINKVSAFAEILPIDKYEIVKKFRQKYVVASTGDGINDLPALKIANVGIAVSGAVTALKSLADIVLLGDGISVIKDAILESRKIFVRLYNYSIYRISESFRLILTILILGIWYQSYPLVPLQLILLAFLNDIPIISLAFDRVKISTKPSEINVKERITLSLLFGLVGVVNSLLFFLITDRFLNMPMNVIQTLFFLKLTVSGHALVFVAHTKERWFKFLPSKQVILATISTQLVATFLALSGYLMPAKASISLVVFVWVWALFWMQISELMKDLQNKLSKKS